MAAFKENPYIYEVCESASFRTSIRHLHAGFVSNKQGFIDTPANL